MGVETTVLVLGVDDADDVLALQTAAYASEAALDEDHKRLPSLAQSVDALAADLADPNMYSLGLRDETGRLVAGVRAYVGSPTAQVGRLCVQPDLQGKGLATRLLAELEQRLPAHVREVHIFTDDAAAVGHGFYAKLGYLEAKHDYLESGFHVVELSKKVGATQTS